MIGHHIRSFLAKSFSNYAEKRTLYLRTKKIIERDMLEGTPAYFALPENIKEL